MLFPGNDSCYSSKGVIQTPLIISSRVPMVKIKILNCSPGFCRFLSGGFVLEPVFHNETTWIVLYSNHDVKKFKNAATILDNSSGYFFSIRKYLCQKRSMQNLFQLSYFAHSRVTFVANFRNFE